MSAPVNSAMGPEIAVLLEAWSAVYVEIPKVACSSIKVALAELLAIEIEHEDPHQTPFPTVACELTASGPLYPGLFSFTFVRNPWDRLVSCYRDKILGEVDGFTHFILRPGVADCLARFEAFRPGMSFDRFVRAVASIPDEEADPHFRSQSCFVTNRSGEIAVDFAGRFESLEVEFAEIGERLGIPAMNLPRLQAAPVRRDYRGYYTTTTRKIVAGRFGNDIELFEYRY